MGRTPAARRGFPRRWSARRQTLGVTLSSLKGSRRRFPPCCHNGSHWPGCANNGRGRAWATASTRRPSKWNSAQPVGGRAEAAHLVAAVLKRGFPSRHAGRARDLRARTGRRCRRSGRSAIILGEMAGHQSGMTRPARRCGRRRQSAQVVRRAVAGGWCRNSR